MSVCYLPSWRELIVRVTAWSLALVNKLYRKKIPQQVATKTAVICLLSFTTALSSCFFSHCSIVQEDAGKNFIPIWSQFKTRSSKISSISTAAKTSSRKVSLPGENLQQCTCFVQWLPSSARISFDVQADGPRIC